MKSSTKYFIVEIKNGLVCLYPKEKYYSEELDTFVNARISRFYEKTPKQFEQILFHIRGTEEMWVKRVSKDLKKKLTEISRFIKHTA